jgi:enoyl-CoA hydratase/carnithine racemase
MSYEVIKIERADNYISIRLNRPEKRNAMNATMLGEIDAALAEVEQDKNIRAVLLSAEGKDFCSGIDLGQVDKLEEGSGGARVATIQSIFHRLESLPVPTIAAVRGAALAGGLQLALHCDLRLASQTARMGMTLGRVGLMVPFDFTRKLIEIIGAPNTAMVLYSADAFEASRALAMGMVHQVFEDGRLEEEARALAEKVASNAPLSLRAMKATIRRCMSKAFEAPHDDIDEMARAVRRSQDAKEGVRAFLEKRKPVWRAE